MVSIWGVSGTSVLGLKLVGVLKGCSTRLEYIVCHTSYVSIDPTTSSAPEQQAKLFM